MTLCSPGTDNFKSQTFSPLFMTVNRMGLGISQITEATGLSQDEIEALRDGLS